MLVREHITRFERGLQPKQSMNIGIQKIVEDALIREYGHFPGDEQALYDIVVTEIEIDYKYECIDYLLKKLSRENIENISSDIMEGMWNMTPPPNLVPYANNFILKANFHVKQNNGKYILITKDWDNFFNEMTMDNAVEEFVQDLFDGDAFYKHYSGYDYINDFEISDLINASIDKFDYVIEAIQKFDKDFNLAQITHTDDLLDYINAKCKLTNDLQYQYIKLRKSLLNATNETIGWSYANGALERVCKEIMKFWNLKRIESPDTFLYFEIDEKNLNKFIYSVYVTDNNARLKLVIPVYEESGDFDLETFKETFQDDYYR